MNKISIHSNIHNYQAEFYDDFSFFESIKQIKNKAIIADANIIRLYSDLINKYLPGESIYSFEAIEENKTINKACEIYEWIISANAKKNMTLVSLGGGITQDVTGFVASTLYRGINWIFIPTTLLAQTDSCIGSKTSINFKSYKNLIGTFYPPGKLFINTSFINTLTERDFYSGLGEVIKFQLMKGGDKNIDDIFALIESCKKDKSYLQKVVHEDMIIKLSYMEGDEFDAGRRNLLNYGHCFGHALESSSSYYIPHGIAVNIGIIFANIISVKRNLLNSELSERLTHIVNKPNIYIKLRESDFEEGKLLAALKNDKKRIGNALTVVIPENNNFELIKADDVTEAEFKITLNELKNILF
ncbi:MAG: hypothetical protein A2X47_08040 [Lentisphaerae bacterium GWF2_38_69]|nr:MAG: hypothetical protein A2X47_08040 [Lentisphaerae bacterium GWF2_38_69]